MSYNSRPLPVLYQGNNVAPPGLGDPVSIATAVTGVASLVSNIHFLQYPKDRDRMRWADAQYQRALAGDRVAEAFLRLQAGIGTPQDIEIARTVQDPQCVGGVPSGCGAATEWARKYMRARLLELEARRAAGQVGSVLIGQSDVPATMGAAVERFVSSPWLWAAVAGVGAFIVLRRRRRYRANPRRGRRRRARARVRR